LHIANRTSIFFSEGETFPFFRCLRRKVSPLIDIGFAEVPSFPSSDTSEVIKKIIVEDADDRSKLATREGVFCIPPPFPVSAFLFLFAGKGWE